MSRDISFFLYCGALLAALAACASPQTVELPGTPEQLSAAFTHSAPTPTPAQAAASTEPVEQVSPSLETPSSLNSLASPEAPAEPEVRGSLEWDASPQTLLIQARFCCGLVPESIRNNALPDAQVWGDGRIVWVQSDESTGSRRVLTGQLTTEQLQALLQQADQAGFFGWQEEYRQPLSPTDMASKCLSIHLAQMSKQVCEYFRGAPEAFHQLYGLISQGAGTDPADFIPERGYLTAYFVKSSDLPMDRRIPDWDAAASGVTLGEAVNGLWIEGEALRAAWKLVSANPFGPLVQEGDAFYQLSLQIPGLSLLEPPAP